MFQIEQHQFISIPLEDGWDFLSNPKNLNLITPDDMSFEILTTNLPEKVYPGLIINYHVKPMPFYKTKWTTEITQVEPLSYFVDEQRVGPYKIWHHEHWIKEVEGGIEMRDLINYLPPYGFIGSIANSLFIRNKLKSIFDFRRKKLEELFPLKQTRY